MQVDYSVSSYLLLFLVLEIISVKKKYTTIIQQMYSPNV